MMIVMAVYALVVVGVAAYFIHRYLRKQRLREHGTPGVATILRMDRTLMQINRRYVYDFLLEIKLPGRAPYTQQHSSTATDWNAFILEPGVRLNVKVDPENPQHVVVLGSVDQQRPQSLQALLAGAARAAEAQPADPVQALKNLQSMLDNQLITQDEYAQKKAEILGRL